MSANDIALEHDIAKLTELLKQLTDQDLFELLEFMRNIADRRARDE